MSEPDFDWADAAAQANQNSQYDSPYESARRMTEPPDIPDLEPEPDKPDASLLAKPRRTPGGLKYETKIRKLIGLAIRATLSRPATVPDSAALILYGPKVARAGGDLAAQNPAIGKLIDGGSELADNATLSAISQLSVLLAQIVRNHEPELSPAPRAFTIPLLKRQIRLPKIGIKLGLFRNLAHEPDHLVEYVLGDPDVQRALKENGITLVADDTV